MLYPVVLPLIVVLVLAALKLDDALHPPLWVHALIWPPVITVVILGAVRLVQARTARHSPQPERGS